MSKIALKNVSLAYQDKDWEYTALENINLQIKSGEFVSVIGPSGCGKSTLLSLFAGLNFPTEGSLLLDGKEIRGTGTERGMVFQDYSLFPWMSAKKNIIFGLRQVYRDKKGVELESMAEAQLEKVGLKGFMDKYPSQLSGGMQQRVAIARAFAMNPGVLLMDEPFGAVDAKNRIILQDLLLKLWDNGMERKTVIMVTHDIDEAILLSDRIVMLSAGPGTVKKEIIVDFPRPRQRESLIHSHEYSNTRNKLISLLFEDLMQKIGGSEVVI